MNVTLFRKGVFVDVIKNVDMTESSWIIQVDPKSNDEGLYKRHT